ncbi:response regulator transcription factor [Actinoplanes derwentensis]|uniref:DNA-binding response regulator, OmpR family, contains REC and winged-helix (WHTH) domain n=1 Tax=Actinoplanes derwentensis TaxID=113562 RepID=A0A1H2DEK0_9ACTN|nr:response regulator transcription factor [Actinoplanes derwentensis]GID84861.1 transcriptional regulatory protein GlnR [Actinoplanes derwentensis]SDT80922.1 DNA-binding response regulator, OmpR family, contains REC and winged-helix (wHTH) domain [Actinoplanes derwentensis]
MNLLLLTDSHVDVLPVLDLLPYAVQVAPQERWAETSKDPQVGAVLVDASGQLNQARAICRALRASGLNTPLIALVREAGLAAVGVDWCIDDFVLTTVGPAEVAARLSMLVGRRGLESAAGEQMIHIGDLTIDPHSYTTRLRGESLALTYKEFELLKFLAQQPGRVFSRDQLLREVWGYDYFGGTRTVDVHVRRLRAKLGPRCETMIGTVRQVGYKFVPPSTGGLAVPATVPFYNEALQSAMN